MAKNWEAELARLSIFTLGTPMSFAAFDKVTGIAPLQTMNRPSEKTTVETGNSGKYLVVISSSPSRADFQLSPSAPGQAGGTMGTPTDVIRDLMAFGQKWITQPTDCQRLALGLTLGQEATSADAAFDMIAGQISSFSKGSGSISDFVLQINRPRPSRHDPSIQINRLNKWQAGQFQMLQLMVGGQPIPQMASSTLANRAHVEIDINTSIQTTKIEGRKILDLIHEFGDLALEISEKGDIP